MSNVTPERAGRQSAYSTMLQHARAEWSQQSLHQRTARDRATLRHLAKIYNRLLAQSGMDGDKLPEHAPYAPRGWSNT